MLFSSPSSFCLDLGLSKGCSLVGVLPLLFAQVAATTLRCCVLPLSEPNTAHTLLMKPTADLVGRKAGECWRNAALSTDQRQPEISSTFEKLQVGARHSSLKYPQKSAHVGAAPVCSGWGLARSVSSRGWAAHCEVCKPSGWRDKASYPWHWEASESVTLGKWQGRSSLFYLLLFLLFNRILVLMILPSIYLFI